MGALELGIEIGALNALASVRCCCRQAAATAASRAAVTSSTTTSRTTLEYGQHQVYTRLKAAYHMFMSKGDIPLWH
jgi:hypothetical protein